MQAGTTTITTPTASDAPMLRLAAVEVQTIMTFQMRIDLLRFSRCSRQLLADADTEHVWRHQPWCELVADTRNDVHSIIGTIGRTSTSSFMRYQPGFSLSIDSSTIVPEQKLHLILHMMEIVPRIKKLSFRDSANFVALQWRAILEHSSLDLLLECHLLTPTPRMKLDTFLSHIRHCTRLQALTLPREVEYASSLDELLSELTCTSLTFHDVATTEWSLSVAIMNCERLTKLDITSLVLRAEPFHRVFTSTHLCKLKELSLDGWRIFSNAHMMDHLQPATMKLLRETWAALTQLETLSFRHLDGINFILPTLKSCTNNFKRLYLTFTDPKGRFYRPSSKLLFDLLAQLLNLSIEYTTHGGYESSHEQYQELESSSSPARFKYTILHDHDQPQ